MALPSGENFGAVSCRPEVKGTGSPAGSGRLMSCERYSMDSRSTLERTNTSREPSGESEGLATPVR